MFSSDNSNKNYDDVERRKPTESHITGRTATGRLINDVARITGYNRAMVKEVIIVFLQLIVKHLVNHNAVSLRWLGTFTFKKARSRMVATKKHIDDSGNITWDMEKIGATSRVKFRPTQKLKQESRWLPFDEVESETEEAREREQQFMDSLTD